MIHRKKGILLIGIVLATVVFVGCEVDFSPNAQWKEVPIVYCVLDQDDDTTWARVERCYLGEGNIYQYSANEDSIHYSKGQIKVRLVGYRDGIEETLFFRDTLIEQERGVFANSISYYCPTRGRLHEDYTYRIYVYDTFRNQILCQSQQAISLISKKATDSLFTRPYSGRLFAFKDGNNVCQIEWNALENARLYQPYIRLYYEEHGDTTYTDVACQQVASRNQASTYAINYSKSSFLESVKNNLQHNTISKRYLAMVDIFLLACTEDLKSYMYSTTYSGVSSLQHEAYSNIELGLGILAARRTHLYKHFAADNSDLQGGLKHDLQGLEVGF